MAAEVSALREENQMLRNRVQDIESQMMTVNQDVSRSRQEQARELQHGQQTVSERVAQLERKLEDAERRLAASDQRMAELDRAQQARMQQMQERILTDISAVLQSTPTRSSGKAGATAGPGEHVVSSGETLSTIARQHGTSTQRLMEANGITNPNQVRIGQVLKIP
jgi:LysM repeat protein